MKRIIFSTLAALAWFGTSSLATALNYTPDQWERQIVAACLILEASDQGEQGMTAVANVMNNRAGGNPSRIYKEVRKPYAFTSLNSASTGKTGSRGFAGHVTRASRDSNWRIALRITDRMYEGTLTDLTHGATHYSVVTEYVSWMRAMRQTVVIGNHKFLRKS
ncbi:MAG: cell wall hydrolase [Verrucomicrobia bacterium]|nr:cell wall hydrolase [Verrucomicrobiota bacterium]